jgi:hypothetical protein
LFWVMARECCGDCAVVLVGGLFMLPVAVSSMRLGHAAPAPGLARGCRGSRPRELRARCSAEETGGGEEQRRTRTVAIIPARATPTDSAAERIRRQHVDRRKATAAKKKAEGAVALKTKEEDEEGPQPTADDLALGYEADEHRFARVERRREKAEAEKEAEAPPPAEEELMDQAMELGRITAAGSWYSCDGVRIGQGKDRVREFLRVNPGKSAELRVAIAAEAVRGLAEAQAEAAEAAKAAAETAAMAEVQAEAAAWEAKAAATAAEAAAEAEATASTPPAEEEGVDSEAEVEAEAARRQALVRQTAASAGGLGAVRGGGWGQASRGSGMNDEMLVLDDDPRLTTQSENNGHEWYLVKVRACASTVHVGSLGDREW